MEEAGKRFAILITEGLTDTHECYNRCWKCCPPDRMHSNSCGRSCWLLCGVLAWKLLQSHGGCSFL